MYACVGMQIGQRVSAVLLYFQLSLWGRVSQLNLGLESYQLTWKPALISNLFPFKLRLQAHLQWQAYCLCAEMSKFGSSWWYNKVFLTTKQSLQALPLEASFMLVWNSLCGNRWPWTLDPRAIISQLIGLPGFVYAFFNLRTSFSFMNLLIFLFDSFRQLWLLCYS